MKIKSLLIGMLACTALVGCSNEDEPVVNNGQQATNGEKQYVAVNLAMPGNASRAASHNGFADGTDEENKINDATFFFLNANGQSCADAYYVATGITSTDNTGDDDDATDVLGSFDQKTSTLIVMENPTEVPSSIVVLINVGNITGTDGKLVKRAALSDIQAVADNYATTTWNAMPENGMVMSNSTYVDAAKNVIVGAPVGISNIITGNEDAYNVGDVYTGDVAPVTIYVEKVLAKVTVTNNIGENTENLDGYNYTTAGTNGTTTSADETFTVTINKWWLDSTPTTSNLVKAIENYSYAWEWNSIPNYRSYWANSYAGDGQAYVNNKYDSGVAAGQSLYTQENTSQATEVTAQDKDANDNTYDVNNRTKVVVAATLKDSKGNAADMVKWYGKFYSKDAFLITLANLNDVKKYYIKTTSDAGDTYTFLTNANLELVYNTDNGVAGEIAGTNQTNQTDGTNNIRNYEAVAALTSATPATLYTQNNGTWTEVAKADADKAIRSISKVLYWNGGRTYYYVELEHITEGSGDAAKTYYGVVRNHLYQVNLTGLSGLGTPVPNPDKIIVPEKPGDSDMETYISANMIIQAYRVVKQEVTLQ